MKRIFFLACVFFSVMLAFAQETKKVAILETVDKQGNISYANKLILRANLAKAITNTPGYEAYDRTDMDAIMGEQDFQRTGMVSNDQIKRLGEMTGATYVLVAEAVQVDEFTMFITAKLLDVETARTEITDNQMMGATAAEIQRGCQLLAEKLIKPIVVAKAKPTKQKQEKVEKKEKVEEPIIEEESEITEEKQSKNKKENKKSKKEKDEALLASMDQLQTVNVDERPAIPVEQLIKISNNEYRLGNTKMDKKAYENFLYENCPQAWKKYKNGKNAVATGWTFFAIGAVMQGLWGCLAIQEWQPGYYTGSGSSAYWHEGYYRTPGWAQDLAIIGGSVGAGLAGLGLFTFIGGYGSKAAAIKTYNKKCANSTSITFNITAGQNGLGVAMNF